MLTLLFITCTIIFWLDFIDRPVDKIKIQEGKIVTCKGHIPHGFKKNLMEIGEKETFSGTIKVYMVRSGAKLLFTRDIPKPVQQRIRNVFPHQGFKSKGKKRSI